ncbi:hypothetical protein [Micromonospora sp. RTP1Z1]|uniref:hypothetical protein n=1 Tax=Micromonospora sp. RTP1Z1 TaxID=2994043 RepID=UPI0029C766AD|nr:hypothetical protein [Micromonospora sp. RTP1Z1]
MADPQPGLWLVASTALVRPVPAGGRYPHICGSTVFATRSGQPYRYRGRDCAACPQAPSGAAG